MRAGRPTVQCLQTILRGLHLTTLYQLKLVCCEPAARINGTQACMLTIMPTETMCAAIASARNLGHMANAWDAAQDPR